MSEAFPSQEPSVLENESAVPAELPAELPHPRDLEQHPNLVLDPYEAEAMAYASKKEEEELAMLKPKAKDAIEKADESLDYHDIDKAQNLAKAAKQAREQADYDADRASESYRESIDAATRMLEEKPRYKGESHLIQDPVKARYMAEASKEAETEAAKHRRVALERAHNSRGQAAESARREAAEKQTKADNQATAAGRNADMLEEARKTLESVA